METNNAILAAVKASEGMAAALVDLLTRITEIRDIYCGLMDKINIKDEQSKSTAECVIRDALEEVEPQLDDLAYKFDSAIGLAIQTEVMDVIYFTPNNI